MPTSDVLQISLATALAAQTAVLRATGIRLDLRWPNDLVVPVAGGTSLKVGGILTESASSTTGVVRHAAIGVGINLNQQQFPDNLRATATSLRLAAGHVIDRERLTISLLRALDRELHLLATEHTVLDRFAEASSWVRGRHVVVG